MSDETSEAIEDVPIALSSPQRNYQENYYDDISITSPTFSSTSSEDLNEKVVNKSITSPQYEPGSPEKQNDSDDDVIYVGTISPYYSPTTPGYSNQQQTPRTSSYKPITTEIEVSEDELRKERIRQYLERVACRRQQQETNIHQLVREFSLIDFCFNLF